MAVGATSVCLRKVVPSEVYALIGQWGVTHMCCAPTVLTMLYSSPDAEGRDLSGVTIATAGAPPAPHVIRTMEKMGAQVHHLYGLTETYGPYTICAEQPAWTGLDPDRRAHVKARQGVPYGVAGEGLRVVDEQMRDVPRDGRTMGEVVMRGNMVMTGYFNDPDATAEAFRGGWFHSGDLAVWHPDGYVELQDRAKDIIISGGENISSQEVEKVVMEHPGVLEVCVVGVPDDKWGEVPKAFVVPRPGAAVSGDAIIEFTRGRLAHFKCPKHVEFGRTAQDRNGQDPEVRPARAGMEGSRQAHLGSAVGPVARRRHDVPRCRTTDRLRHGEAITAVGPVTRLPVHASARHDLAGGAGMRAPPSWRPRFGTNPVTAARRSSAVTLVTSAGSAVRIVVGSASRGGSVPQSRPWISTTARPPSTAARAPRQTVGCQSRAPLRTCRHTDRARQRITSNTPTADARKITAQVSGTSPTAYSFRLGKRMAL